MMDFLIVDLSLSSSTDQTLRIGGLGLTIEYMLPNPKLTLFLVNKIMSSQSRDPLGPTYSIFLLSLLSADECFHFFDVG